MNDKTTDSLAQALIRDKFLINFNNLVSYPIRTGIQRVCYEFSTRWPYIEHTIPFVEVGMDRIGILDPDFFETVRQLFETKDDVLSALSDEFSDLDIDPTPSWIALLSARNRIICEIPVEQALKYCRAVLSLEESLNLEFFSLAATKQPEKIFNLCHDFLSWTHAEFFSIDWRHADNVSLSISNRRKYTHNIFTSTTTRDVFVNRINRGDVRPYRVIAPGADGLGRSYRKTVPDNSEFLVVGTLEPRKQPLHILHVFERLQKQGHDARLCFAGRMGWLEPADKAELEAAFKRYSWLRWVDTPSDDKLRDLMINCRASIYLSIAEGFGSPPVESLALGVPCIVTDNLPSALDIAPNGQVRVGAHDRQALEDAVLRLLNDDALLALQAQIETLTLPTWQSFVDGIAALVAEKVGAPAATNTSYRTRLNIYAALSLLRRLDRTELVEHLIMAVTPKAGEDTIHRWLIQADRSNWSSVEVLLNIMNAFPDALPTYLVSEALAGNLGTIAYIPPCFVKTWQPRFRSLMQIPSYPVFYEALYTDLLQRPPGPGEIEMHIPDDERLTLRTTHMRDAIGSIEYNAGQEEALRRRLPAGYIDTIYLPSIKWKLRIIDQFIPEAAVYRALMIDDDANFLEVASLDLTGQILSREQQILFKDLLGRQHGREQALLRLLLSKAALRLVKEPQGYLALIQRLALQAGLVKKKRADARTVVGKICAVTALSSVDFATAFVTFLGREPNQAELGLADHSDLGLVDHFGTAPAPAPASAGDGELLAARLALYATLSGDFEFSPALLGWAVERFTAGQAYQNQLNAKQSSASPSPEEAFTTLFGRAPHAPQTDIFVKAITQGLEEEDIVEAVRLAALRAGQVENILPELAYFAQNYTYLVATFEKLDVLADALLAVSPEPRRKAWCRSIAEPLQVAPPEPEPEPPMLPALPPVPVQTLNHVARSEGEIVTVDHLMALDGEDFIRMVYRKLLLREADESGLQNYLAALNSGHSKALIIYNFSLSEEARAAGATLIGLDKVMSRQRTMQRWPVRKLLQAFGAQL